MQKSIDSLFAFTQCEVSISPLCCIISDNKPEFLGVKDILKTSKENVRNMLGTGYRQIMNMLCAFEMCNIYIHFLCIHILNIAVSIFPYKTIFF